MSIGTEVSHVQTHGYPSRLYHLLSYDHIPTGKQAWEPECRVQLQGWHLVHAQGPVYARSAHVIGEPKCRLKREVRRFGASPILWPHFPQRG